MVDKASPSPSIPFGSPSLQPDIVGALGQGRPQRSRLTPSFSMPDIHRLGLSHTLGSMVSSWSPNLSSGSLLEHIQVHHPKVSTFITAFNALRVQLSHLKYRIYGMETENNELKHANMVLRSDSQALEQELSTFRADYYAERLQSKVRIQCARADKDKIMVLNHKLEQAEKFIMAMVDIKLHEPVLGRAAQAVREGAAAEDALIDAVKVAATQKGSAWSRIIPAIVGPRSPEHYLSAINLAVMLQKDLREREKVSSFWKMIAKLDPANANTITPSSSLLSEAGGQDVEHSRSDQAVLDEMIALLANGDTLSRTSEFIQPLFDYSAKIVISELEVAEDKILEHAVTSTPLHAKSVSPVSSLPTTKEHSTHATPLTKTPKTFKIAGVSPPTHISQIPVSPLRSKIKTSRIVQSKLPSPDSQPKALPSISPAKPIIPSRLSSRQPTTPVRKTPLTPIRSRLSTPRTNTFKRPALTRIDLNRPVVKTDTPQKVTKPTIPVNISDDNIKKKSTRDNSKNLAKRRGVIMEEISHPPPSIVTETENIILPMSAQIEIYEPCAPALPTHVAHVETEADNAASTLISTEDPMHIPPMSPAEKELSLHFAKSDCAPDYAKHGSLLAAQALQSLERICAAFSSDSLGSLEMTDAGSDYGDGSQSDFEDLHLRNECNSNAVPPASLTKIFQRCEALLDLDCSVPSDSSLSEDVNLSVDEHPPRPPTPAVKCSSWAPLNPRRHMSSTSAVSSLPSSSSESISIPVTLHSKKPLKSGRDKLDGSPTPARTPIPVSFKSSPASSTKRSPKSLKDTSYKAVPQNLSLLPVKQSPNNGFQQPLPPSQIKPYVLNQKPPSFASSPAPFPFKSRSNTISTVSPLPPTLSTPKPHTLSSASPFKSRSNTINTDFPKPSTPRIPRPERPMSLTKPRSNTIDTASPVNRLHTAKTISSTAKRRSNTLDSYLQVPSKNAESPAKTKAVSSENKITAPTAAFMRRPDVKTTPINTRGMTNCVTPLIPNWSPALHSGVLSPSQCRNMLRGGVL